jgi:hypothetical protein
MPRDCCDPGNSRTAHSDDGSAAVRSFDRLIWKIANKLHRRWGFDPRFAREELYVAGQYGAWLAVRRMAVASVLSPSAFAATFIKNAMFDWLRCAGHMPSGGASRCRFGGEHNISQLQPSGHRGGTRWTGVTDDRPMRALRQVEAEIAFDEVAGSVEEPEALAVLDACYRRGLSIADAAVQLGVTGRGAGRVHDAVIAAARLRFGVDGEFARGVVVAQIAASAGWTRREDKQRYRREYRQLSHVREARRLAKERARRSKGIPARAVRVATAVA